MLKAADYYLLRTPSKPVEEILRFSKAVQLETDGDQAEVFRKIFEDPVLLGILHSASPEIYRSTVAWLAGKQLGKKEKRLCQSLYKYLARMSSRCTPFGLLAGSSPGEIGPGPSHILLEQTLGRAYSRLDMGYVTALSDYFHSVPEIFRQLTFYPNNSIYKIGDQYRYFEKETSGKSKCIHLTSLAETFYIDRILVAARSGASIPWLVNLLTQDGVGTPAAEDYVKRLISSQFLVSELSPTVTGQEYFTVLLQVLKKLKHTGAEVAKVEAIQELLATEAHSASTYQHVRAIVEELVPITCPNLIQTDLFRPTAANRLNEDIVREITQTMEQLAPLGAMLVLPCLEMFKKRFRKRFQDQAVPLLYALDPESGVDYVLSGTYTPLLQGLAAVTKQEVHRFTWGEGKQLLFDKIKEAARNSTYTVTLCEADLPAEAGKEVLTHLPASLCLMGSLLSSSHQALDSGNYRFLLKGMNGPSAANLLGRFCHGDSNLAAQVAASLAEEESTYPHAVLAEIAHLPAQTRTGNVLVRPRFRRYEIPILGKSCVEAESQIPLSDLTVAMQGDRIVLRSQRLQKEVIPRLSNAHNFSSGLPVYRFLCDLQSQGLGIIPPWSWSVFSKEPFLPRIEYKKIILQRARWYLRQDDFLQQKNKATCFELTRYFRALQNQWAIPPLVVLHEGDNELLIDFDSSLSLAILAETLEKKDVEIYEYLFTPDNCFIKEASGSYANEVIIPLSCCHPATGQALPAIQRQTSPSPVKRVFLTGSEWLYVKIYTGSKTADKLISSLLLPLTEKLLQESVIQSWFYIRYQDPDVHLRIRFHNGSRSGFWAEVVAQLQERLQPFVAQGLVSKLVIDTYEREIERYGQHTIHLSEALFASDSSAIAEFISTLKGDQGEQHRWLFALKSIDQLLNDFNYSLQHKYDLLTFLQKAFYEEHEKKGLYDKLLYRLNNKYRAAAAQISALLSDQQTSDEIKELLACFTRRSSRNIQICQKIKDALQYAPDNTVVLRSLVSSYIHMSLNRIFITKHRLHELVIYHYLVKYYDSQLARNL